MAAIPERTFEVVSDEDENTITVLQFNTLADALSDAFPHVSDKELVLDWKHRERRLHDVLTQHQCDFICLQEVDHFHDSFVPFLAKRGYDGEFAVRRFCTNKSGDGTALFWRKDKHVFINKQKLKQRGGKCVGFIVYFLVNGISPLSVAVLHLTAKPGREADRAIEVDNLLEELKGDAPVLVCGDFNDTPDSQVCQKMRDAGFVSVYEHDETSWTTWKKREKEVKRVIDYIWYRGDVRLVARLAMPPSEAYPRMLPDVHHPSDHLDIGAKLNI